MNQLGPTKRVFFQAMYQRFVSRTEQVPAAYRDIFRYLAEERIREHMPVAKWQA